MSNKFSFIVIFLLTLILGLSIINGFSSKTSSKEKGNTWEYKVVDLKSKFSDKVEAGIFKMAALPNVKYPAFQDTLNIYSHNGWELINIIPLFDTGFPNFGDAGYTPGIKSYVYISKFKFIFKRKN